MLSIHPFFLTASTPALLCPFVRTLTPSLVQTSVILFTFRVLAPKNLPASHSDWESEWQLRCTLFPPSHHDVCSTFLHAVHNKRFDGKRTAILLLILMLSEEEAGFLPVM